MKKTNRQYLSNVPTYLDFTESNFFLSGATIIVETISEYLARVKLQVRKLGKPITFINEAGVYNINEFLSSGFTYTKYEFISGVTDNDLTEITHNLSGLDIVTMLSGLDSNNYLDAAYVKYRNETVNDTLDTILNVNVGDIQITTLYETENYAGVVYEVYDDSTLIDTFISGSNPLFESLNYGTYNIKYILPPNMIIKTVSLNNNILTDIIQNNTIEGVVFNSIITNYLIIDIEPDTTPILNYIEINNGDESSSSSELDIELDISGFADYYMISTNPNFDGEDWIAYDGSTTITYTYDYISEIEITVYIKVKNSRGESEVQSDSIFLRNGILRSDSIKKYNSIINAFEDVYNDYSGTLTQNVTIYFDGKTVNKRTENKFLLEIDDFNINSDYYLIIDGSNHFTMDCVSLGGIKVTSSANIIFKNISFINVGGELTSSVPEELCGVFIQGTAIFPCYNMVIDSCNIDNFETYNDLTARGNYSIISSYCDNLTIQNNTLTGARALIIKNNFIDNLNIINNTCSGYQVTGVIGHPAHIKASNCKIVNISDNTFDGTTFDTCLKISSDNIYIKRNKIINFDGQGIQIENISPCKILDISSNFFKDNLKSPPYPWEKSTITSSNEIISFRLVSNTIHLTGNERNNLQEFFGRFGSTINNVIYSNNLIIFDYVDYNLTRPNSTGGSVLEFNIVNSLESENNIYLDTTGDVNVSNTNIFNTSTDSPVLMRFKRDLTIYTALGYEINSRVIPLNYNIFNDYFNNDYNLTLNGYNLTETLSGDIDDIDVEYKSGSTFNAGAYGYFFNVISGDTSTDWNLTVLDTNSGYTHEDIIYMNSSETILIETTNNEKTPLFLWKIYNKDNDTIKNIIIGKNGIATLYSNLNSEGLYLSDATYNIQIIKI
jgi:hypothetical protein